MAKRMAVSVLFGLGLVVVAATAQPPGTDSKKQPEKPSEKKADKKAADPLDGLIGAALVNDPDVKVAHAKLQLADAELAKARQAVTLRVLTLHGSIQEQKRAMEAAADLAQIAEKRVITGAGPQSELIEARGKLESAKAKLAQLETEL